MPDPDTIAAIATPPGRGGVGIVRVSGPLSQRIAQTITGRELAPRVATYATFHDVDGAVLDRGIALLFAAPASYTGEAVLELQGHGSPPALRLVLSRCLGLGARIAEPGEFTRRAYLNGKLDLAQAESVADLIEAATTTAARAAARSLAGEFSREVHHLVDALTELRVFVEATLDFPDEDIEFVKAADARGKATALSARLDHLLARASAGQRLNAGLSVVLIGRPNVGKSSLLNRLVRSDAAIVTAMPGTTRDPIERAIEIGGIPLTVVDTAGLRDTADEIERIGIARAWAAVERADVALVLVDAREGVEVMHEADRALLDRLPVRLPRIVVHNKTDLAGVAARREKSGGVLHVWLSARSGEGVEYLEREVMDLAGIEAATEDVFIARARHVAAIREARDHVAAALEHLGEAEPPLELFAEELREAQQALATITGEFGADDLLGAIFSRFCIGK